MTGLPSGFKSISGDNAAKIERARQIFFDVFGAYGYRVLLPSTLQLFGSCRDRLSPGVRSRMLSVNAPSGETCCLRPDLTLAAVEHMGSSYSPDERPLRVCYGDRIFRIPTQPDLEVENFQLGAELLGWEGEGADVELLTLLLNSLDALEVRNSFVVIGDVMILENLLQEVPFQTASALRDALGMQSFTSYREILSRAPISEALRAPLRALPSLRGGVDALEAAAGILPPGCPLEGIGSLLDALNFAGYKERVFVDLSLTRELDYYSGPIFEIFSEGQGRPVGGGGRYDGLLSSFGIIGQATGFSLNLEQILEKAPDPGGERMFVMAWSGSLSPENAMLCAKYFSDRGIPLEMSWVKQRSRSVDLARHRGYRWWTDLSDDHVYDLLDNSSLPRSEFPPKGVPHA